jgi:hypothetical protein
MTKDKQIKLLKQIINDTFWMARRYVHGRHTYAPSMVRDAYLILSQHFPDLVPEKDNTIYPPKNMEISSVEFEGCTMRGDYLDDINLEKKRNG